MLVADSPARAKTAGFSGIRTAGLICAYCSMDASALGIPASLEEPEEDDTEVLQSSTPAVRTDSQVNQDTAASSHYSVLSQLHYFDIAQSCPPDPMHAINLGLCKRFWHLFLIDGCTNIGGRLKDAQAIVNSAKVPSRLKRPSNRIGDTGGGNPTAEEWSTLFRGILPFVLTELWAATLNGCQDQQLQFYPRQASRTREVRRGAKSVRDVYQSAMMLCVIVDMMERKLTSQEVAQLQEFITDFNESQANLLGPGWLTYNSHLVSHIPDFIRRFGAPHNFLMLSF